MYCANCNSLIEKGTKFCQNCGIGISKSSLISKPEKSIEKNFNSRQPSSNHSIKTEETPEAYMQKTDIKSTDEAQSMLSRLKITFWAVAISLLTLNVITELSSSLSNEFAYLFIALYFGVLIYFVFYCMTVLKAVNLPRTSAFWCVFFAPFGWFYLYPLMANPLKIILGKLPVPSSEEAQEKNRKARISKRKFYIRFWIIAGVLVLLYILTIVVVALII
jgi:hypothetical protein